MESGLGSTPLSGASRGPQAGDPLGYRDGRRCGAGRRPRTPQTPRTPFPERDTYRRRAFSAGGRTRALHVLYRPPPRKLVFWCSRHPGPLRRLPPAVRPEDVDAERDPAAEPVPPVALDAVDEHRVLAGVAIRVDHGLLPRRSDGAVVAAAADEARHIAVGLDGGAADRAGDSSSGHRHIGTPRPPWN